MLLRHLHLPRLTHYTHASRLQDFIVAAQLAHKANPTTTSAPNPTIITAQFHPVYTCGRREVGTVTPEQKAYLTETTPYGKAEFHEALRGGQTTFHGPGQLIAYPILDLRRHNLTPRCYIHLLEKIVIDTCAHYAVPAIRTENPGVWANNDEKVCAVGVHLRRNVSSHGIGLNVNTDLRWFGRIVGCGLEGKGTTSLVRERGQEVEGGVESVARVFVKKMAEELDRVNEVVEIDEANVA